MKVGRARSDGARNSDVEGCAQGLWDTQAEISSSPSAVSLLLRDAGRIPLLSKQDEQRLGREQGRCNAIANRLLLANPLVARITAALIGKYIESDKVSPGKLFDLEDVGSNSEEVARLEKLCAANCLTVDVLFKRVDRLFPKLLQRSFASSEKETVCAELTRTRYKLARLIAETGVLKEVVQRASKQAKELASVTKLLQGALGKDAALRPYVFAKGCRAYLRWRGEALDEQSRSKLRSLVQTSIDSNRLSPELRREMRLAVLGNLCRLGESPSSFLERVAHSNRYYDQAVLARNAMVEANIRLVTSIARKYLNKGSELEDLVGAGYAGLVRGCEKFKPEKGRKLSTYVSWWIKQGVTRWIQNHSRTIRIPSHKFYEAQIIRRLDEELRASLGRKPTIDEQYEHYQKRCNGVGLSREDYQELVFISRRPVELNGQLDEEEGAELGSVLLRSREPNPATEFMKAETRAEVLREIEQLLDGLALKFPRQVEVVRRRFGLRGGGNTTLQQLADELAFSREYIRQVERQGLDRLARAMLDSRFYRDLSEREKKAILEFVANGREESGAKSERKGRRREGKSSKR